METTVVVATAAFACLGRRVGRTTAVRGSSSSSSSAKLQTSNDAQFSFDHFPVPNHKFIAAVPNEDGNLTVVYSGFLSGLVSVTQLGGNEWTEPIFLCASTWFATRGQVFLTRL